MEECLQGASPVNPQDLIRIAGQLASGAVSGGRGRPRQAELRRAISTAYYALFHALALCSANLLAGSNRGESSWQQTYRALEHGHARNQCDDQSAMNRFPLEIQFFARQFVAMQNQRQRADYSPTATFSRERVMLLIGEAGDAIDSLENATAADRRAFAIHVLFRRRRE